MPGAQLLLLDGDLDAAAQVGGQFIDGGADPLAVLAQHDREMLGGELGHRVQGVREHGPSTEGVQHLGGVRTHPGAGAGGQHQYRGFR